MFIRTVVGPTDFTPVVDPLSNGLTKAQQMALAVLYESGVNTMADVRSAYLDSEVRDFYMSVPALRDETLFLGGEPGGERIDRLPTAQREAEMGVPGQKRRRRRGLDPRAGHQLQPAAALRKGQKPG